MAAPAPEPIDLPIAHHCAGGTTCSQRSQPKLRALPLVFCCPTVVERAGKADTDTGNYGLQLSLRLILARRDERAAAVNRDDQPFVP